DLPEIPDTTQTPFDRTAVVDRALIGALFGALVGGFSAALAAALLGAVGARLGGQFGPAGAARGGGGGAGRSRGLWSRGAGAALGGGVGAAVSGVLLPRWLAACLVPWRSTVLWFLVGTLLAAALSWQIGTRFEWAFYRWALAGAALGTLMGALCEPVRLAR